jgi:hypothetical protein
MSDSKARLKYVVTELGSGALVSVHSSIEDAVGNDYYYFQYLEQNEKKEYRDTFNDKLYSIVIEGEEFNIL